MGKKLPVTTKIKNFWNLGVLGIWTCLSKNTTILVQPITPKVKEYWELGVLGNFIYEKNNPLLLKHNMLGFSSIDTYNLVIEKHPNTCKPLTS